MVLLAAAAASGKASAQQATPPTQSTGTKPADALEEVIVTGVRQSQIRAIQLKRDAPSIQDSISAESIGQ
jgi:hypothetical protein